MIVLVTGTSRGLGRAMAEELSRLGHVVVGCGRSGPVRVDVADDAAVAAWAAAVLASPGIPDILVNNAALMNSPAPLWKVPAREFSDVVDVNIKGTVNVLRHFLPPMIARKRGIVVNMSSGWGRSTDADVAPYCATKWAIEGLTQALAQELPRGMAAVALNPGIIDTDMLRSAWGDGASSYPQPGAWAKVAVPYILGLRATDNGQSLTVPG